MNMDAINNNMDDIINVHEIINNDEVINNVVNNVDETLLDSTSAQAEASEQVGATIDNIGTELPEETDIDIHAPIDNFLE